MLKASKKNFLKVAKQLGVFNAVGNSKWRQDRLLILGYHGVALEDEHLWNSELFVTASFLRRRFEILQEQGCTVLSLDDGITHLYNGTLPKRSVVITFDDGLYDFYRRALPVINEFGFPATLYLTTFYSQYNKPVFTVAADYLLWKARTKRLRMDFLFGSKQEFDLGIESDRRRAHSQIIGAAMSHDYSAEQKDELLAMMCSQLDIDYDEFCEKRILQLMNAEEISEISRSGIDVQLHTHRHCVPKENAMFGREIEENRRIIETLTNRNATHFCYPSGEYDSRFLPWLRDSNVVSATTCEVALSTPKTDPFLLPRLLDTSSLSEIEFRGWVMGASHFLPQRAAPDRVAPGEATR
jgi:peptidoglycan/xylan/chitin deacetylase (PgdA/CDA1 family)